MLHHTSTSRHCLRSWLLLNRLLPRMPPQDESVPSSSPPFTTLDSFRLTLSLAFKIPETKFLLISAAPRALPLRRTARPKESLGIVAGQPLPRNGHCKHYSKSHRWFRFSCCAKVFACDRCHDAETDHPNEHANRMICGFCSREQNYRPQDCGSCHMVREALSDTCLGFWCFVLDMVVRTEAWHKTISRADDMSLGLQWAQRPT